MARNAFSKVMRVGRATTFLVGLAVVLALVLGVATTAMGANGNGLLLGVLNNAATKVTGLVGNVDGGPALRVANPNAGTNDTALDLRVQAGEAPMRVNSAEKVTNLNADKVDGLDSTRFATGTNGKADNALFADLAGDADKIDGKDSSEFAPAGAFGATRVINRLGPLPREGTFTSKGGTVLILASGSGYRANAQGPGWIGMSVKVDGNAVGQPTAYANEKDSHRAFVDDYIVLGDLPAGQHTIRLEAAYDNTRCNTTNESDINFCTVTDFADLFRVSVVEIAE